MTSTSSVPDTRTDRWRVARPLLAIAFWALVWQGASLVVHQKVLLVGPWDAAVRLAQSLARAFETGRPSLQLFDPPAPIEWGMLAQVEDAVADAA